ncbi:cytochrome P450 [Crepidotus variabilis]|uniref:Cytochrome P450 n=1 Tax=Crepidotus variabilis TaxID=179855 RepID=A0A9P6EFF1_9AGAR|nr:cytochrome P450 [Crepidotus variabilis]
MNSLFDLTTIAAFSLSFTLFAVIRQWLTRKILPLPPGPSGNLIFGTSIPSSFPYRHFEKLTQEYGPMISFRQGLTTVVVIGRLDAATDVMEKQGALTADRPRSITAGEILSGGMRTLFTPFGDRFKRMRRALHTHLQPKLLTAYAPVQMRNAKQLVFDIVDDPKNFQHHSTRYSASILMSIAYGMKIRSYDDPEVLAIRRCLSRLAANFRPGHWKVEDFPFLRYIPGYLKELYEGHLDELTLFKNLFGSVREQLRNDVETPHSFAKYLLESQDSLPFSENEAAYLAGTMYGAGTDTTSSMINVCIMAAAAYPELQQWVWEELEQNIGKDKPPTMSDQESLPRTMAWVLEAFRWRPVTAGGFAHKASKDIISNGYLIPKGASVYGNIWSVNRDPTYFPDPEIFNPKRWINVEGRLRSDLRAYSFGFGRRVCPGQHVATSSVFIATALLLWAFDISSTRGAPIDVWGFTDGANAHPLPFSATFKPRFSPTLEAVKSLFDEYDA